MQSMPWAGRLREEDVRPGRAEARSSALSSSRFVPLFHGNKSGEAPGSSSAFCGWKRPELEGGSPSCPADVSAPPSPRFSSLAPSQVAVLSKFASPTPTHPARAPQLAEFKALLSFHPLRSPPPALDYSIRDYASASSLLAKWGLCQGQHKFQPVSLITVRPAHWKL